MVPHRKSVSFCEKIIVHQEDPIEAVFLHEARINNQLIFQSDIALRYFFLLSPILDSEHRQKIKTYIEQCIKGSRLT